MEFDSKSLSTEELLRIASDSCRRTILQYLQENSGRPVPIPELLDEVLEEGHSGTRHDVKIQLLHNHLPYLAKKGLIEHDERRNTVVYECYPPLEKLLVFAQIHL